MRNYGTS